MDGREGRPRGGEAERMSPPCGRSASGQAACPHELSFTRVMSIHSYDIRRLKFYSAYKFT